MWPWGHLAVGYVVYSLFVHARYRRSPRALPVIVLAFGTQFPDVVDKPLAWSFGVLPNGQTLAHSLLFAAPFCIALLLFVRWQGRWSEGVAFTVGYLTHLPGDIVYPALFGRGFNTSFLLWPVTPARVQHRRGFRELFTHHFEGYLQVMQHGDVTTYLVVQSTLLVGVLALWMYDGAPGVREPLQAVLNIRSREHAREEK